MAVVDDAQQGFARSVAEAASRVLAFLLLLVVIVGPLVIGGVLGHFATKRLADPVAMAIEVHRPPLPVSHLLRRDGPTVEVQPMSRPIR